MVKKLIEPKEVEAAEAKIDEAKKVAEKETPKPIVGNCRNYERIPE